ncbi:MAG TPA: hypothetical protein VE075_02975 [Thermoanaerobaculia bacterium]|nr:hypothetical protein [Thermoanaerobaculia bacterium]
MKQVPVAEAPAPGEPGTSGRRRRRRRAASPPHRICLLGESAAAGMFYRPHVTPAQLLAFFLGQLAGPGRFEVLDVARPAQTSDGLQADAALALTLNPSMLVAFAGNNWVWSGLGPDLSAEGAETREEGRAAAAALTDHGVPGLAALVERRQREQADRCIDAVAGLAGTARVPLLWVVPEVNLADVTVAHPVYWLPGDGVRRWYRAFDRASRRLAGGELAAAAREAERLILLDGGACAASRRLLARACQGLDGGDAARAASRAEVDAASWDPRFRRASGVNSPVLAALRAGCRRHGLPAVDLPEVFAEACGAALPGRRLFLDHCHLALEGMTVAMAAVACAVAHALAPEAVPGGGWRELVRESPPPEVPPEVAGMARLQAGLYCANLDYRGREWIDELFTSALDAEPGLRAAVRDYLLARAAPCSPSLTAACRRNRASALALDPLVWARSDLGGGLLEQLCGILARHGCDPAQEIVPVWLAQDPMPGEGRDLAVPRHREAYGTAWDGERRSRLTSRAFTPTSTFRVLADARQDLELELTARLPAPAGAARAGQVVLAVNGQRLAAFRLDGAWRYRASTAGRRLLRPGINRISLEWPLPAESGDAALAEAVSRLRLGIPADLYPVFGEVASLKAVPRPSGYSDSGLPSSAVSSSRRRTSSASVLASRTRRR